MSDILIDLQYPPADAPRPQPGGNVTLVAGCVTDVKPLDIGAIRFFVYPSRDSRCEALTITRKGVVLLDGEFLGRLGEGEMETLLCYLSAISGENKPLPGYDITFMVGAGGRGASSEQDAPCGTIYLRDKQVGGRTILTIRPNGTMDRDDVMAALQEFCASISVTL